MKFNSIMELYQLKTFVMVAAEGHLTRAAERLHTSQPAVSAHIKALEEELGVALFKRTPKGMLLTREGEVLREQAVRALSTIDEIHYQANVLKDEVVGTVRLGLHIDPRFLRIDEFLSCMQKKYRKVDFHLLQQWSWEQPMNLKRGKLDAGFIYGTPNHSDITIIPLRKFNIVVAGPAQWADKLTQAGWEEMAEMPWVWTPPECSFCKIAIKAFEKRHLKPFKVTIADQEPVVNLLVTSGVGLAFMIEEEALEAKAQGKVAIWDEIIDTVNLSFIFQKNREKDPLVRAVVESIKKVWGVAL
jgi:DNA-binding transcriptional LysR family regulator